ncbi:MAG: amidohydrolase [Cyclobacteriaceae bacterium]
MKDLKVSLIQTAIHWEQPEANTAMFEEKIWSIDQTDLIVLPEMFTTGFSMNPEPLAEPPGGRTFKWMKQMASQKNVAITGSYIVKDQGKYYNRLYFVFPDGTSQKYDKKHLFTLAGEDENYSAGSDRLIVEYRGWKICPMICYDLRFPVWSRSRTSADSLYEYDLLIYVASWPDARINAWDTLLKARAIENQSYCIGVNRIGTDPSSKLYPGHSAVYSYLGNEVNFSPEEEVLSASLDQSVMNQFRERFPFQQDADQIH